MANNFNVTVDVSDVLSLGDQLAGLTPDRFNALQMVAVNKVATEAYALSRRRMNAGINLSDAYITSRMQFFPARDPTNIRAEIVAPGGSGFITGLGRYSALQAIQPTKTKRVKGDPKRGIPRGMKSAGVSVEVRLGGRKVLKGNDSFIDPTRHDSEGNPYIFRRSGGRTSKGTARLDRLFGPSVYQLFRVAAAAVQPQAINDLRDELLDAIGREFKGLE